MRIHFVFIGEGSSDDGLIPHLESLCIEAGADEVTGTAVDFFRLRRPPGNKVVDKLRVARYLEPGANLLFIHRDADRQDPAWRYQEIANAVEACRIDCQWVAVVPVQETEAWLLLDEIAIRQVVGQPSGRRPLNLPPPRQVEGVARPKERLKEALVEASGLAGRRLDALTKRFPEHRKLLLQRLPLGGPLSEVPSWVRLRKDIVATIEQLRTID